MSVVDRASLTLRPAIDSSPVEIFIDSCESVSLFQDKTTCCRAFAGTLRTCWFTFDAILFDAISFGSSTITEESLAFLNKDYRCGTAVRRISSAFSNGDYVFALRGADWHDRKTVSRSVVRESRAHKLSPWSVI